MTTLTATRRIPAPSVGTRPYLTVVTGLPCSGASLLLRMLSAGGLPSLSGVGLAPRSVTPPLDGRDWIRRASGTAIALLYRDVYDLPTDQSYRVVIVRRDIDELLAEQKLRLFDLGHSPKDVDAILRHGFLRHLARFETWLATEARFPVLGVDHGELFGRPDLVSEEIAEFLGGGLDTEAMAEVVENLA